MYSLVIKQLATDKGYNFPAAKSVLENNIYVDDVLFGTDKKDETRKLGTQVIYLLEKGCFHLKKRASYNEL